MMKKSGFQIGLLMSSFLIFGCGTQKSFTAVPDSQKIQSTSAASLSLPAADTPQATLQWTSLGRVCQYELFPLAYPTNSSSTVETLRGGQAGVFAFGMYNASNLTHGHHVLNQQGLPGNRFAADMTVAVSNRHAARSVDLILSSYEPTRWNITGNTAAVRSVRVSGYHCAAVTGVSSSLVSITTVEQSGSYGIGYREILNLNAEKRQITYEGTSLNRQFQVD